jgi:Tfp pilus assembly protein PilE
MKVAAQDIKVGDMLLNNFDELCLVTYAELIRENKLLYYLTVEDHTFCIAPYGLCVHNAEAFIFGVSSMCLGHTIIVNPVAATIGATLALSAIAHKAYQAYIQRCPDNDQKITLPTDVILAERSYYIQRSTDLETIKQELLYIKNDLENIKVLCDANSASFTYQFLKQTNTQNIHNQNQLLKISVTSEIQLSDKQKENLRSLREIELKQLEQEVVTLQIALAFHINELIEQIYDADNEYKQARKEIDTVTVLWNNNLDRMTDSIALQLYQADLIDEHLLNNLNQKVGELKTVAHYYCNCMNTLCIEQSTNIIDLLGKMNPVITEYDQRIAREKIRVVQKVFALEQYFARCGISIEHIKNETKNYLAKGRNVRNAQAIAAAKNKLASMAVSGEPENNNNKNDDNEDFKDFWENAKSRSDKHARSTRFGKMYRDPITKLWWAQDLAGHGGSSYKVFTETTKGFEWVYDAAKDGIRVLNKHKGPVGLFIPYKEVIFRT